MEENTRGKFIVFEGPCGSGKSTQAKMLFDYLEEKGIPALITREPGGTAFGEDIRKLFNQYKDNILKQTQRYLMFAQRLEHYEKIIKPNLKAGVWVICDRYHPSTIVYQDISEDRDNAELLCKSGYAHLSTPWSDGDMYFFLIPGIDICKNRIMIRDQINNFSNMEVHFAKIYQKYDELAKIAETNWFNTHSKKIVASNIFDVHIKILESLSHYNFINDDFESIYNTISIKTKKNIL